MYTKGLIFSKAIFKIGWHINPFFLLYFQISAYFPTLDRFSGFKSYLYFNMAFETLWPYKSFFPLLLKHWPKSHHFPFIAEPINLSLLYGKCTGQTWTMSVRVPPVLLSGMLHCHGCKQWPVHLYIVWKGALVVSSFHLYFPIIYPFARQAVHWGPFIIKMSLIFTICIRVLLVLI